MLENQRYNPGRHGLQTHKFGDSGCKFLCFGIAKCASTSQLTGEYQ